MAGGSSVTNRQSTASVRGAFDARRDRAIGAFFGLAVGDALGTTIEF